MKAIIFKGIIVLCFSWKILAVVAVVAVVMGFQIL
jgi:hypothetical protein